MPNKSEVVLAGMSYIQSMMMDVLLEHLECHDHYHYLFGAYTDQGTPYVPYMAWRKVTNPNLGL